MIRTVCRKRIKERQRCTWDQRRCVTLCPLRARCFLLCRTFEYFYKSEAVYVVCDSFAYHLFQTKHRGIHWNVLSINTTYNFELTKRTVFACVCVSVCVCVGLCVRVLVWVYFYHNRLRRSTRQQAHHCTSSRHHPEDLINAMHTPSLPRVHVEKNKKEFNKTLYDRSLEGCLEIASG